MIDITPFIAKAVEELAGPQKYILRETNSSWSLEWYGDTDEPEKTAIENKATELAQAWFDAEYQRARRKKYPPLEDLADALYWQAEGDNSKMTEYLAAVCAVKEQYPKE
jgi:hypothetical protein